MPKNYNSTSCKSSLDKWNFYVVLSTLAYVIGAGHIQPPLNTSVSWQKLDISLPGVEDAILQLQEQQVSTFQELRRLPSIVSKIELQSSLSDKQWQVRAAANTLSAIISWRTFWDCCKSICQRLKVNLLCLREKNPNECEYSYTNIKLPKVI